ncbi:MAG: hypothetical protein ACRDQZ_03625 [Mycobacteriales bacterium]
MLLDFASHVSSVPLADTVFIAAKNGNDIADQIKNFVAPLAAVIIGVMGIRFLVGEQKSLAGFIGFLLLGIIVYALIEWGQQILNSLGEIFRSWVA